MYLYCISIFMSLFFNLIYIFGYVKVFSNIAGVSYYLVCNHPLYFYNLYGTYDHLIVDFIFFVMFVTFVCFVILHITIGIIFLRIVWFDILTRVLIYFFKTVIDIFIYIRYFVLLSVHGSLYGYIGLIFIFESFYPVTRYILLSFVAIRYLWRVCIFDIALLDYTLLCSFRNYMCVYYKKTWTFTLPFHYYMTKIWHTKSSSPLGDLTFIKCERPLVECSIYSNYELRY